MQTITKEQFDNKKLLYSVKGRAASYFTIPMFTIFFAIGTFVSIILLKDDGLPLEAMIPILIFFTVPLFTVGTILLIRFIKDIIGHKTLTIGLGANEIYIRTKKVYTVLTQKDIIDVSVKTDKIQTLEMRKNRVDPLNTDNGYLRFETIDGDYLVPCCQLEKTVTLVNCFISDKDIKSELKKYNSSFENDFVKKLLIVTTIFGSLCCLEILSLLLFVIIGFSAISSVVLSVIGASTMIFGVGGVLYVFISPQLKHTKLRTNKVKEAIKTVIPEVTTSTDFLDKRAETMAETIRQKCMSNIKGIMPFVVICVIAVIGVTIGLCFEIYPLLIVAVFIVPFSIFILSYFFVTVSHFRSMKAILTYGEFVNAKIKDFVLGSAGLGRLTLEYYDNRDRLMTKKTPYLYSNDDVKKATLRGYVNIKIYRKKVLVIL